ncbi:MAG: DNA polymerase III subunit beta [Bacteroidales bacterium]|jgi:DNA polymerase-3 subunit beta|nr:DNA polymerase III subunit beta [Bacteroidales bacterium]
MKFRVSSKELSEKLQISNKIISSKSSISILGCYKFEVKGETLTITSSDLDNTLIITLQLGEAGEEGVFALNSQQLSELVKEIPEQPITFDVDFDSSLVKIYSSNGEFQINLIDAEEYPQTPTLKEEKTTSISINSDIFVNGINNTLFATSKDDMRPIMTGILIELEESGINFVATDSHKLAKYHNSSVSFESEKAKFVLSQKAAENLKSIIKKTDDHIILEFDEKNAIISLENIKYICRFIEGAFPDYNQVIPTNITNVLIVDNHDLQTAVKSAGLMTNKGSQLIGFSVKDNELTVTGKDLDYSTSGKVTVKYQSYQGDDIKLGYKHPDILEILKLLNSPNIQMQFAGTSRATLIYQNEEENENEKITMLIMPLMIND